MESNNQQLLVQVLKELRALFYQECSNLPRPEIDRLWEQEYSDLVSSVTDPAIYDNNRKRYAPLHDRMHSAPIVTCTNTSKLWKAWSPILAASKVTDEEVTEPLSSHGVLLSVAEGTIWSPQIAPTRPHLHMYPGSQQNPEGDLVECCGKRKRKRSFDTVSTYDLLPPPYALSDVVRPPDAPKLGLNSLNIGCLQVRRLSNSEKIRISAVGDLRDDLPQSHRRGVNDFQAAILLGEELALQDFSRLVKVWPTVGADTMQRKISALFSLCISVGALFYNADSLHESQARNASRSATEAHRVLSNLQILSEADIQIEEDEDRVAQFRLEYKGQFDFNSAVAELDTVIANLAACSFDLQMVKIM